MATTDVTRKLTIEASQNGAEETAAALRDVAGAQNAVAVATVNTDKAVLSIESRLNSLKKSLDDEYSAEAKLESIQKTLTAARNQGAISINEENRLLDLASEKYRVVGESAKQMGERLDTAKEFALGLIGGLGAGLITGGLAELPEKINETVESVAKLGDVAGTIDITTKSLQELDYAATQNGSSTQSMNEALEKFSTNLGKAKQGSGELFDILKTNGLKATGDLNKDLGTYADLLTRTTSAEQ